MNWISAASPLIPTILLLLQGISCLTRTRVPFYVRKFGVLCVLLAGLCFVLTLLLLSGTLVLSEELGLGMVQGLKGWCGMAVLLIGFAVSAGLSVHVSRIKVGRPRRLGWLLGSGGLVGCLAVWQLRILNPSHFEQFRIYAYDFWWPPLLIWLSACLVEIALTIITYRRWVGRIWSITLCIAVLAHCALWQPHLANSWPGMLWRGYLLILLPVSMSVVTWLSSQPRWWIRRGLAVLPAGIGVLQGVFWLWSTLALMPPWQVSSIGYQLGGISLPEPSGPSRLWPDSWLNLLWLSWPLLVALVTSYILYPSGRTRSLERQAWRQALQGTIRGPIQRAIPLALPKPSLRQGVLLTTIAILTTSLAALVYLVNIDRLFALAIVFMAWFLLAEVIAEGRLTVMWRQLISQQFGAAIRQSATTVSARLGSWFSSLVTLGFVPTKIGKVLVGGLVLLMLLELPNARQTLIYPFKAPFLPEQSESGTPGEERNDLGQAMAERTANTLGQFQQALRKQLILSLQFDEEGTGGKSSFTFVSAGAGNVDIKLGNEMVPLGGLEVPLDTLLAPIQGLARKALGVLAINGSLQGEGEELALLASSSEGETWRVPVSPTEQSKRPAPIPPASVVALADELAFHILRRDSTLEPALTSSWGAFDHFRKGLAKWEEFERNQDSAVLAEAIQKFQDAIQKDSRFAFAHYHLGLAQQKAGQPSAAVDAFRTSIRADPNFIPAYNGLAATLFDFERYYHPVVASLSMRPRRSQLVREASSDEASHLWQQIVLSSSKHVSIPNRASAYYGLCRQALRQARYSGNGKDEAPPNGQIHRLAHDEANLKHDTGQTLSPPDRRLIYYVAYYYCRQAEALYSSLAEPEHTNPEIIRAKAYVLQTLGVTLERLGGPSEALSPGMPISVKRPTAQGSSSTWHCSRQEVQPNAYARDSLQYYLRALTLLPDDRRIHCYAARAASLLGNHELMAHLEHDAIARVNLAVSHRKLANTCSSVDSPTAKLIGQQLYTPLHDKILNRCTQKGEVPASAHYYQKASEEYAKAITYNDTHFDALIGYANTFWEWWIHWPPSLHLTGPSDHEAALAERYARRAVILASTQADLFAHAMVQSILGKVLLARGRSEMAIEQLQQALKQLQQTPHGAAQHPTVGEVRRSLLFAHRCTIDHYQRVGLDAAAQVKISKEQIIELQEEIRQIEHRELLQADNGRLSLFDYTIEGLMCTRRAVPASVADPARLL